MRIGIYTAAMGAKAQEKRVEIDLQQYCKYRLPQVSKRR